MLTRIAIGVAGAASASLLGVSGVASAQPQPAPPGPPDVNAFAPVKPSEYAVMDGSWYAFSAPGDLTCVLQRTGGYGCSGPLPGAPNGANLVSGGPGAPGFAHTDGPVFAGIDEAKPLPANSRISFQTVSCGTDGVVTSCVDNRTQGGFVIDPAGSYTLDARPLTDRPEGTNPFFN